MWLIVLIKITVIVRNLLDHCQILGLDVLAEHGGGCVPRDFHNVVDIHSGKIHQSRICAPVSRLIGCSSRSACFSFLLFLPGKQTGHL